MIAIRFYSGHNGPRGFIVGWASMAKTMGTSVHGCSSGPRGLCKFSLVRLRSTLTAVSFGQILPRTKINKNVYSFSCCRGSKPSVHQPSPLKATVFVLESERRE